MSLATESDLSLLLMELAELKPASRSDMMDRLKLAFADSLEKIIDTHNTKSAIFVIKMAGPKRLALKAEYGSLNATHKEITWYRSLPNELRAHTPAFYGAVGEHKYAVLILEFIEGLHTIDELVSSGNGGAEVINTQVLRALAKDEYLFQLGPQHRDKKVVDELYGKKYEKRRREADKFPYLRGLLERSITVVNGRQLRNPGHYLSQIINNPSLYSYLTPSMVGLIHGDLHCGNVLIKNDNFYFIDPNGWLAMPIEYDYGKLLHSVHGGYDAILQEKYCLQRDLNGSYSFELFTPSVYGEAKRALTAKLTDQQYLRALYAEALHFATMLPHHAQKETETTVLFIRCIQIFDELFSLLGLNKAPATGCVPTN